MFSPQCPVRSCTICAHAFLFGIELYSFGPVSAPCFGEIRLRCFDVLVPSVHSLFHCALAIALMCWIRDDFNGGCVNGECMAGSVAARFASVSAHSLPSMSIWPGIQTILRCLCGHCPVIISILSRIEAMMLCPDCFCGF